MTGVLSILAALGLVMIISIDHPFTGPVRAHPGSLAAVLAKMTRSANGPSFEGEAASPAQ